MRIPWPKAVSLLIAGILAGSTLAQTETDHSFTTLPLTPGRKIMDVPRQYEDLLNIREHFAIDSDKIVKNHELAVLSMQVDSVLRSDSVTSVNVKGYASVDGPVSLNISLAKRRAQAMRYWLTKSTGVNPSLISIAYNGEDWAWFEALVKEDPDMPAKEEVIRILDSGKSVTVKQKELKALRGGQVWRYMAENTFPVMRVAEVSLGGFSKRVRIEEVPEVEIVEAPVVEEVTVEEVEAETVPEPVDLTEIWMHKLYIKTNAPAWLCLWINAAVEYDLAPHWSVALPIYYSGFNYFTSKVKFRTFTLVPELRWWPRKDNMGFFLNVHAGMNLFNYAKGGDWRYQTYKGHTPAIGGGIGLGYRWYFCKNKRWSMEAGVGAGIYKLDYSIFQNFHNGLIVGREKRTFYGIDQASLSFEYSFGVKEKEVKK